jgi:2-oxoglutarate dehydrogenase E1 component
MRMGFTKLHEGNNNEERLQKSDNTRHLATNPKTGQPYLLPPPAIRRVILCSGQIYYHLSAARRNRRIRDVVLVRLEQIAPFPFDLIAKVGPTHANV